MEFGIELIKLNHLFQNLKELLQSDKKKQPKCKKRKRKSPSYPSIYLTLYSCYTYITLAYVYII